MSNAYGIPRKKTESSSPPPVGILNPILKKLFVGFFFDIVAAWTFVF